MTAADYAVRAVALSLLVTAAATGGVALAAFMAWEALDRAVLPRLGIR